MNTHTSTALAFQNLNLPREIANIVQEMFLAGPCSPDEDLVDAGIVDSLTLIQLLAQLEERFAITIPLSELDIEDIRSIASLAHLVANRMMVSAAAVQA